MDTRRSQATQKAPPENKPVQTPPAFAKTDKETLLDYYYHMLLIRRFEEKTAEMYNRARIGGYCHLNLGEEATVVGFCAGLEPDDYVYTNYREHGYAIAYRDSHEIVACQMGDGTTNGGPFHESLNMAKVYRLPIVYFIVNNQYGMGLEVARGSAVPELHRKACAYDMRSERVDGNDVLAVRDAVREAARIAREEHQPSLIEAVSFRFRGHSVVDPDRYRSEETIRQGRALDPIPIFAEHLKSAGKANDEELQKINERVDQTVEAAVKFAEESPDPPVESLFDYIYAPEQDAKGGQEQ